MGKSGWENPAKRGEIPVSYTHLDYDGDVEDEVQWYYFESDGEPKVGPAVEEATVRDLEKIGGVTYLFDNDGNPVYGLRNLKAH